MGIKTRLQEFQDKARRCSVCQGVGLLHRNPDGRRAYPVLHKSPKDYKGIVAVMEVANRDDTYGKGKGYITCDPETDPTGRFLYQLLKSVGLTPDNIIFTNAALCFPVTEKNPKPQQLRNCTQWLARLVDAVEPKLVVTFGKAAMEAVGRIENHGMAYQQALGQQVDWHGRKLLSLAHPSALGRANRKAELQMQDVKVISGLL